MKFFTKILFLILSCYTIGYSQVQIGNGTSENVSIPMEPYYGYSYSQSIYLQSEISATGSITSIEYYYSGTSDLSNSDDNIQIWISHTTKSEFTGTTDWEPVSGMTQVFSGSIPAPTSPGTDEWLTITLNTPFPYNNTDNLIIAIDANEAGYDETSDDFHCTSVSSPRSLYYRSDSTNPDPTAPPTAFGTRNSIPNTILGGLTPVSTAPGCSNLTEPADGNNSDMSCGLTTLDIEATWEAPTSSSGADSYDVYLGTTSGSLTLQGNTTQLNYTFENLTLGTYYWQVIPKNSLGSATGCQENSFNVVEGNDSGSGDQSFTFANSYGSGGPTYSWIDPVASGHTEITAMTSGSDDDGYFHVTDMGITFNYYAENNYTDCYIGTNGYVSFGAGFTTTGTSSTIPTTTDPDNMIAACMMDLDDRADGQIFYGLSGSNFVITWLKYHDYNNDDEWISFQVILEGDADGGFTIQYNETESSTNVDEALSDAVIGAEFADSEGVVYRTDGSGGPIFCSPLAVGFSKAPLPIDLLSFEGKAMKNDNKLMWVTAMEDNTEWHIIERSLDGRTKWEEIGRLSAQGFSQNDISYELNDKNPMLKSYYRLKSVDYDGQFEISDMITISRTSTNKGIRVFPNPTKGITNIEFTVDYANLIDINITDISGKPISTSTFDAKAGINRRAIDMSKLSKGVYFISVLNGTENITQKVIKL